MGKDNWCKHYNGYIEHKCRAEIDYEKQFSDLPYKQRPCTESSDQRSELCPHLILPTEEENKERRARIADRIKFMGKAFTEIATLKGHSGTIQCPKCKQELQWSRASINGHVHGTCSTTGCLRWMQ